MSERIPRAWRRCICRQGTSKSSRCRASQIAQRKRTLKDGERDLKKSSGILCKRAGERIRFAKKELTECDTGIVCDVLRVSRSTFYRVRKAKESEEIELEKSVINCFEKHKGNYGRIRIKKDLFRNGIIINENKISRILKEHGLVAKSGRTGRKKTPKPKEEQYIEENLIKDKFEIDIPNYLWCSDITELVCKGNKVYTCGIIDVATRRLVGWSIKRHQRQDIVQEAFEMAVGRNPERPADAVYHSDR